MAQKAGGSKKKYEVILNAAANGLSSDEARREIEATSFTRDANSGAITFYDGDDVVAFYQFAYSVTPL